MWNRSPGQGETPPPAGPPPPAPPPPPAAGGGFRVPVIPFGDGRFCWCGVRARVLIATTGERVGVGYYACGVRSGQAGCSYEPGKGFLGW